jgi:hypothetical protein
MAKKPLYIWNIMHIQETPDADFGIGTVEAPDAETAIQVAIEHFQITDPEQQKWLVAQRAPPKTAQNDR